MNSSAAPASSDAASSSTASSTAASSVAPGSLTQLNAEQIAAGQQLSDSAANLTWFNDVGQAGPCGKFSKTFAECEAKSWELMLAYIDAQLEQYQGFSTTMADGACKTEITAMIADITAYKAVMTEIHGQAQKMDQKAMQKAASSLPSPTVKDFAGACGVPQASPSAEPSTSTSGSSSPSPSAS